MLRSFHLRTVAVILFFLPGACLPAQTISTNFILRDIPKERISDTSILRTLTPQWLSRSVQHFDGLGRPVQECLMQASPQMNHLVRFVEYDLNGRQPKDYLMFAVPPAKGTVLTDPGEEQRRFFSDPPPGVTPVDQPYAEVVFDTSPLNEVIRTGAPGKTWDVHTGHPSLQRYSSNPQPVPRLVINPAGLPVNAGAYPVNSLFLSETTDENGHVSRVYSDKKGRTILTETLTEGQPVQTFYVYDDRDLLRAVIQPEGVARGLAGNPLFSFLYRYDSKKRLIEKHIPAMEAVFIVYDKLDRPLLTQDGNLRKRRQWLFNRYDAFGRIIMTGILTDSLHTSRESLQELADRHDCPAWEEWLETEKKYSDRTFPAATITPLSFNYYDQYEFIDDTLLRFVHSHDFPEPATLKTRQRATGTRVRVTVDNNTRWLTTVHYYDVRGRTIQTVARNHTGGWDRLFFAYDFRGRLLRSLHVHSPDGKQTLSLLEHYAYDHADRLTDTWRQVNNQPPVLVSRNIYNELGQLMEKKLHSQDGEQFLQSVTYTYNGRGWLTAINNPDDGPQRHRLFAMEISYDNPPHGLDAHGLYNGNISSICWATGDQERRAYAFIYDELNRLTAAHYRKYNGSWNTDEEDYSVPMIRYDLNGNIDTLARHGRLESNRYGLIDAMKYYYYGNRLIALDDDAAQPPESPHFSDRGSRFSAIDSLPEYTYDANGNMTSDANKGLVLITYDHMNLPSDIWLEGDRRISFTRDALGRKLTRRITGGEFYVPHKTDYIGNFVYVNDSLAYILTEGGRLIPGEDGFVHEYFLTDHLGNIRLCFRDSAGLATVTQLTHYYPFGMEMHGLTRQREAMNNPYLFNGKELHEEHGVMWYDYRYRFYDPQIARFHSIDRLADKYPYKTPYDYAENRPVDGFDLDGLEWTPAAMSGAYHPVEAANSIKHMKVDPESQALGRKMFTATFAIAGGASIVYSGAAWIAISGSNLSMLGGGFSMSIGTSKLINAVRTIGAVADRQADLAPKYVTYIGPIIESATGNETIAKYSDSAIDLFSIFLGASTTPGFDLVGKADAAVTAGQLVNQIISDSKMNTLDKSNCYQTKRGDTLSSIAKENDTTVDNLVKLNNISNPNKIQADQNLILK